MTEVAILIGVLLLLNIVVILLYIAQVKHLPPPDDIEYYDEDGNHIYYDRRIIKARQRARHKVPSDN